MSTTPSSSVTEQLQQAFRYLQEGQLAQAEQLCRQLCVIESAPVDALQLLAVIYAQTQRSALADQYFLRALALAPERADILGNYANLLWETGRIEATIEYCQRAITLKSQRPEVFNTLGNAWFRLGRFKDAEASYRQALHFQADYSEAHNNLGQTLASLHDYRAAEQCFRNALAIQPDFILAAENLKLYATHWLEPLVGRHLLLRRYGVEDAAYIKACYQNQAFMQQYNRFLARTISEEALSEKLAEDQVLHPSQLKAVNWTIRSGDSEQAIGIAGLVDIQWLHRRAEFVIGIPDSADRRAGSGLEATLLIMDFAFNRLRLNKLMTIVYADNDASLNNNHALGFRQESLLKQHLRDPDTKGYIDLVGNALTEAEFRQKARLAKLSRRLLGRDVTQLA